MDYLFLSNAVASDGGWLVAAIGAAVTVLGGLGTAFVTLWQHVKGNTERLERKLDHCETQHEGANRTMLDLSVKVAKLEGRTETAETFIEHTKHLNKLAEHALKKVE